MPLDANYIRSRVPGFFDSPGVPDFALTEAISAAQGQVNRTAFGASADEATFLLACHIATMNKPGRADGAKRFEADRVKMDLGTGRLTSSFYEQYLELKKRKVLSIGLANSLVTVPGLPGCGG